MPGQRLGIKRKERKMTKKLLVLLSLWACPSVFAQTGIRQIVGQIDLKCYAITGEALNLPLRLDHLNPLLMRLPPEEVIVLEPQQLCVPVAKEGVFPPDEVLRLVQYIDLKCYSIQRSNPLNMPLLLDHLNPVLRQMGLPPEQVQVLDSEQLCVPVAKEGVIPPDDVLPVIEQIDQRCYRIEPRIPLDLPLHLDHLNPVLQDLGVPPEDVIVREPLQLCVPVAKNGQFPPGEIRRLVQFIDQKCYRIEPQEPLDLPLHLDHLNPVFRQLGVPPEDVVLREPQKLCVPVAKNQQFPPD
jgi:hypothetical protein